MNIGQRVYLSLMGPRKLHATLSVDVLYTKIPSDALNRSEHPMEAAVCKENQNQSGGHSRQYATASSFSTPRPKKVTRAIELLASFQRICVLPLSDASLENYFQFELLPHTLSLSDKAGIRKTKSTVSGPSS